MSLTAEQKKVRLTGIGGSEIAAVVGLNPFATALDVYRAKVEGWEPPETYHMQRGNFLEAGVADWYAARCNATLRQIGTVRHPARKIAISTPDRIATTAEGDLDLSIKFPSRRHDGWGEPGTDEVPAQYLIQVQWELMILEPLFGIGRAVVAAPLDGDLCTYPVLADAEIQGELLQRAERFWRDFIVAKRPPPLDASDSAAAWLKFRFPQDKAPMRTADESTEVLAAQFFEVRGERESLEEREKLLRHQIEERIGEAAGLVGHGWEVTWKRVKGRLTVDWQAIAAEAHVPHDIIQKYTRIGEGYRRFCPRRTDNE